MAILTSAMVLVGLLGFPLFLIILIINAIRKKPVKNFALLILACLLLFMIGIIFMPSPDTTKKSGEISVVSETPLSPDALFPTPSLASVANYDKAELPDITQTSEEISAVSDTSLSGNVPLPTPSPTLIVYYDKDDNINLYVNKFNESNPDWQFSADDLSVYYHHARNHYDQAKSYKDGYEIVINGNLNIRDVRIFIGKNKEKWSSDDYKKMFIRFALPYNPELTEEILSDYWQQVMDDLTNSVRFSEFQVSVTMYNNHIDYMVIDGSMRKRN